MASKKEPPFFNEDNIGSFPCKLPFYETMELFIETLTGTCFELRVSPYETVASVKSKIQRLEGIPVAQQHLIWNNMELEDECSLSDYNISEGCTLKMVLAMRGGPINTRRVPLEDPIREIAEYMDPIREDLWEKGSSNKQVTFLVYREGEQLNFFRVVDRGDGTLTPLSESLSGASVYNLYAEDEDEAEGSPSGQHIIENAITMNKMKLLKSKMENMNLNKKPKKMAKLKPRPPMIPRPTSGLMSSSRHRLLRVLPHIGQSYLPPGNSLSSESPHTALSAIAAATRTIPSIAGDYQNKEARWETPEVVPSLNSVCLPPTVSRVELENPRYNKNKVLPPVAHLKKKDILAMDDDSMFHQNMDFMSNEESSHPITDSFDFLTDVRPIEPFRNVCTIGQVKPEFKLTEGRKDPSATETSLRPVSKSLNPEAMDTGINTSDLSPARSKLLTPVNFPSQISHLSPPSLQCQSKCFETGNFRTPTSQNLFRSVEARNIADRSFSRTARFRGVKVNSPGKQSEVISKMEARDITELANKASKEPIGSLNHLGFFGSLSRCTSRDTMQSSTAERPSKATVTLSNSLHCPQEERFKKILPSCNAAELFVSALGHGETESNQATGKGLVEATHLFAPVKSTFRSKKKTTKNCFVCGKKTGLATSFECRRVQTLYVPTLCPKYL
ncbi:hypothetical protein XENTR_v10018264 [Xenopus tropicalis]|nr:hypothetical protein XENTR_v10018264 [Xenopus tropicalis]